MSKKRNRITSAMSKTIAESSPLIKSSKKVLSSLTNDNISLVEVQKLTKNPYQPRIDINLSTLNSLIQSIEKNGLLQPIVVTKKADNYIIIAGHRRVEAYKILGKDTIKASILENIEDKDLAVLSLTENLIRENLHPIENAISIKFILDQKIVTSQNKLAEYLGLSKGHISKMMNILKLPLNLIKRVKELNYRDINILVLLNKITDDKIMLEVFEDIKNLQRSEAEKLIKEKYLSTPISKTSRIISKTTKNKISFSVKLNDLDEQIINDINNKFNEISVLLGEEF